MLTGDQLMNTAGANAYDAIHTLRPEMLTGHGLGAPDVYIRDLREPKGVERLKEIPLAQVQQVQYLKPEDAPQPQWPAVAGRCAVGDVALAPCNSRVNKGFGACHVSVEQGGRGATLVRKS